MRSTHLLTLAVSATQPATGADANPTSPIAFWIWYSGIMLVGAAAGTVGALAYSYVA